MTQWKIREEKNIATFKQDADALAIHPLLLAKASRRNIFETEKFFRPTRKDLPVFEQIFTTDFSPSLLKDTKVALYADYDVDGMTSAYIMELALKDICEDILIGYADLNSGFGVRRVFVEEAIEWGADWLVTLDCGSSDSAEIAFAKKQGLKTIVVDHHNFDTDNPTDYHFNPQFQMHMKKQQLENWLENCKEILEQVQFKQKQKSVGLDVDLTDEINKANNLLDVVNNNFLHHIPVKKLQEGQKQIEILINNLPQFSHLTGSALAWIFGQYCLEEEQEYWYQEPLYLASLGILADMGSLLHIHNRAIYRLSQQFPPQGIVNLAEAFHEDPLVPTSLIRTKAALNLAKRTQINPKIVPQTLRGDKMQATMLAMEAISASNRKNILLEKAEEQAKQQVEEKTFLSIILEEGHKDAGQSGVIANSLARKYFKPTIVFVKKSDNTYKFSARNTSKNTKKLGQLITDPLVIEITKGSLGGHEDVLSGNCQTLNEVHDLQDYLQTWAEVINSKEKSKDVWVDLLVKHPKEVQLIIEQTKQLLAPISHDNWGINIGVIATLHNNPETEKYTLEIGEGEDSFFLACTLAEQEAMIEVIGEVRLWKLRLDEREILWLKESIEL